MVVFVREQDFEVDNFLKSQGAIKYPIHQEISGNSEILQFSFRRVP